MENDTPSIVINVPKPRAFQNSFWMPPEKKVTMPRISKRTLRKPSETTLKRYTLPQTEILPVEKLKRAKILLPYKMYSKAQNRDRFLKMVAIPIHEKYKIISTDIKKRLYIRDSSEDVATVPDIEDAINRCVFERSFRFDNFIYKSFKNSINRTLQIKLETGLRKDCNLNVETNFRNEKRIFNLTLERLTDQAKYFDTFISEDYKNSRGLLATWDKLKDQVESKSLELENLAAEKFTIMARIIGLEYRFSLQQKYGRFLYYLSPPSWRLRHRDFAKSVEIEARGFDYGDSCEEDNFTVIFEKMQKLCASTPIKPALYFSQPKDLIDVFEAMEKQQLHHFAHVNQLTPYTKILRDEIKVLGEMIDKDTASIKNYIKKFENILMQSEERCDYLKAKFFKILFGLFFDSVAAIDVLKLQLNLEFCFEKVFYEKPSNMDIVAVASAIEGLYMDYSKRLDTVKSTSVRRAITRCVNAEKVKLRRAVHAANELRLFHRLERELLQAHGLDTQNVYKPVDTRLSKTTNKFKFDRNCKNDKKDKNEILTEAEKEYLHLFTDWTPNEDPAKYLQSLTLNDYVVNPDDKL
ncbi:unnamed protein product [Danaus chrysippus]|uniref:(African queen) hypothetical protein n=1 Tax=Danaus chrysippus TaxID=151541 RepID=A0A8J2QEJ7_9NEOP|nr:unnamed protein product [Danaus chrysippus]